MSSLQGNLLIATPRLVDPNFFHTVVLLVQHDEQGALGVVLNRPMELTLQKAWEDISQSPCSADGMLYQGGPCEGLLLVVHTEEELAQLTVMDGLHFSSEKDAIEQLVVGDSQPMKFFVGYAGWSPGQLEKEVEEGSWLVLPAAADHVFRDAEGLWESLTKQANCSAAYPWLDPKFIPDDPSVN